MAELNIENSYMNVNEFFDIPTLRKFGTAESSNDSISGGRVAKPKKKLPKKPKRKPPKKKPPKKPKAVKRKEPVLETEGDIEEQEAVEAAEVVLEKNK